LEFIQNRLKEKGIIIDELNIVMQLGSSESIKNYLLHSDSLAFLSISTVLNELKNNQLTLLILKTSVLKEIFILFFQKVSNLN
jgi:hypothetical protein